MFVAENIRQLVDQRLAAAADEIFGIFEKTIAEYEGEVLRSRREVVELKRMIEQLTVLKPTVSLDKLTADSQLIYGEEFPLQQSVQLQLVESQEIKEEKVDVCVTLQQEADSLEDVKLKQESQTDAQTNCQLSPTDNLITMTLDNNDKWDEMNGSASSSHVPSFGDASENRKSLNTQSLIDTNVNARRPCLYCPLTFRSDMLMMKHVAKSHVGKKAFKCSECDKGFGRRDSLKTHERFHRGERPYRCRFCEKFFTQSSGLKVHLRIHTGEKPYFCKTCGKMVAHSYHLKTCGTVCHKSQKLFRCLVCGKRFQTAVRRDEHMNVHEARRPYTAEHLA